MARQQLPLSGVLIAIAIVVVLAASLNQLGFDPYIPGIETANQTQIYPFSLEVLPKNSPYPGFNITSSRTTSRATENCTRFDTFAVVLTNNGNISKAVKITEKLSPGIEIHNATLPFTEQQTLEGMKVVWNLTLPSNLPMSLTYTLKSKVC